MEFDFGLILGLKNQKVVVVHDHTNVFYSRNRVSSSNLLLRKGFCKATGGEEEGEGYLLRRKNLKLCKKNYSGRGIVIRALNEQWEKWKIK